MPRRAWAALALGVAGALSACSDSDRVAAETVQQDAATQTAQRDLHFGEIHFALRWNTGGATVLEIVPSGLGNDNTPIQRAIDGQLRDAVIADLDADDSPELYVFIDGPSTGQLLAWVANRRRSLSEAAVIGSDGEPDGRGRWRFSDGRLLRDDARGTVPYRLRPGEATWRIEPADADQPGR